MPKINELPAATALTATDVLAMDNTSGTATKKVTGQQIKDFATADVNAEVTDLKNALIDSYGEFENGYFTTTIGQAVDLSSPSAGGRWSYAVIPCEEGDEIIVSAGAYLNPCMYAYLDSNFVCISRSGDMSATPENVVTIAPEGSAYILVNNFSTLLEENKRKLINKLMHRGDAFSLIIGTMGVTYINLFNPDTITAGKYLDGNGDLGSNSSYFASDFINVSELNEIALSYTHIAHWYDENRANIGAVTGMNTLNADTTVSVPSNAKYIRFSTENAHLTDAQVGYNVTRNNYVPYGKYTLPNLVMGYSDNTIIVDANGNGDYTSFTEAVYQNPDDRRDIIVKPGTYDIVAEYIALFGQSVVDNLADSTTGINNFQFGVGIHDRKVTFEAGAKLVCDWTGHTCNGTHRFCPLRVMYNAEIVGLDIDSTATFYTIHDDYGTPDNSPFTNTYQNCRVIGHNLVNANCIGGGCHKYSRHILENCYFKNNVDSTDLVLSADVRYHNTNTANAEPEVYVSNCYFSNNLNVTYYGTQTTKMRAYVNNCYAPKGIIKRAESSTMQTDNVELYTWNNQTA